MVKPALIIVILVFVENYSMVNAFFSSPSSTSGKRLLSTGNIVSTRTTRGSNFCMLNNRDEASDLSRNLKLNVAAYDPRDQGEGVPFSFDLDIAMGTLTIPLLALAGVGALIAVSNFIPVLTTIVIAGSAKMFVDGALAKKSSATQATPTAPTTQTLKTTPTTKTTKTTGATTAKAVITPATPCPSCDCGAAEALLQAQAQEEESRKALQTQEEGSIQQSPTSDYVSKLREMKANLATQLSANQELSEKLETVKQRITVVDRSIDAQALAAASARAQLRNAISMAEGNAATTTAARATGATSATGATDTGGSSSISSAQQQRPPQ